MRDEAMKIQKELESEIIEYEENGIKVVITGDQKIKELTIDGETQPLLVKSLNSAIEQSRQVAAKKLQGMAGGLGGLLGQ